VKWSLSGGVAVVIPTCYGAAAPDRCLVGLDHRVRLTSSACAMILVARMPPQV
jgi:hypothetical protein